MEVDMPTRHPRVMTVIEPPLYAWVRRLAKRDGVSLSLKMRDLLREVYETHEDLYWAKEGERRLRTFKRTKALNHDEVWKSPA
jgi:hypothetical protein